MDASTEMKFADAELRALDAEVQSNLSKVDEASLHLLIQCQSALYWGGNWSLIAKTDSNYNTIAGIYPSLRERHGALAARVKGGILLQCDENELVKIMCTLAPTFANAHSREFLERVNNTRKTEVGRFESYWKKTLEGKTEMFKSKDSKGNNRLSGILGVYCTNVNPTITINGINYPAFKLSPFQVMDIIHKVGGVSMDTLHICLHDNNGKSQWVPVSQAMKHLAMSLSFPIDTANNPISRPNALLMRFAVNS